MCILQTRRRLIFYRFYGTKSQNRGYFHNAMRLYMLGNNVHKHAKFQVDSSIDV